MVLEIDKHQGNQQQHKDRKADHIQHALTPAVGQDKENPGSQFNEYIAQRYVVAAVMAAAFGKQPAPKGDGLQSLPGVSAMGANCPQTGTASFPLRPPRNEVIEQAPQ